MVLLVSMRGLCLALLLLTSVACAGDNKSLSRQLSRLDSSSGSSEPDSPISVLPSSFKSLTDSVHNKDVERVKGNENTLTLFEQEDPKTRTARLDKLYHRAKQSHGRLSTLRPSGRSNSPSHQEKRSDEGSQGSSEEEEKKTVDLVDLAGEEKGEKPASSVPTSPSQTVSFSHQPDDHSPLLDEKPVIEKPDPKPFYGSKKYFDNQKDREKVHERKAHPKHSLPEEHSWISGEEAPRLEEGLHKREKLALEKEMDDGHIERWGHKGEEGEEESMKGAALPSTSGLDPRPLSPAVRTHTSPIHSPRTDHEGTGSVNMMQDKFDEMKITSPSRDNSMPGASTPSKPARKREEEDLVKKISRAEAKVNKMEAARKKIDEFIEASRLGRRELIKNLIKARNYLRRLKRECIGQAAKRGTEDGTNVPSEPPRVGEKFDTLSDPGAEPHKMKPSGTKSDSDSGSGKEAHKLQVPPKEQEEEEENALRRRSSLYKREKLDPEAKVDDWVIEKRGNREEKEDESMGEATSSSTSRLEPRPLSPLARTSTSPIHSLRTDHEGTGSINMMQDKFDEMMTTSPTRDNDMHEAFTPGTTDEDEEEENPAEKLQRWKAKVAKFKKARNEYDGTLRWARKLLEKLKKKPSEHAAEGLTAQNEEKAESANCHCQKLAEAEIAELEKVIEKNAEKLRTARRTVKCVKGKCPKHTKKRLAAQRQHEARTKPLEPPREGEKVETLSDPGAEPHKMEPSGTKSASDSGSGKEAHKVHVHPKLQEEEKTALRRRSHLYKREILESETEGDNRDIEKRGNREGKEDESMQGAALPSTSGVDPRPLSLSARTPSSPSHSSRIAHEDIDGAHTMQDTFHDEIKTTSPARETDMLEGSTSKKTDDEEGEDPALKLERAKAKIDNLRGAREKNHEELKEAQREWQDLIMESLKLDAKVPTAQSKEEAELAQKESEEVAQLARKEKEVDKKLDKIYRVLANIEEELKKAHQNLKRLEGKSPKHPEKGLAAKGRNKKRPKLSKPPREEEKIDTLSDPGAEPQKMEPNGTESDSDSGSGKEGHKVQASPHEQEEEENALRRRSHLYKSEKLESETERDDRDIEKRGFPDEEEDESMEDAASPSTSRHEARPLSPSAETPTSRTHLLHTDHEGTGSINTVQDRLEEMKITSPARDNDMPEAYEPRDKAPKEELRKQERPAEMSYRLDLRRLLNKWQRDDVAKAEYRRHLRQKFKHLTASEARKVMKERSRLKARERRHERNLGLRETGFRIGKAPKRVSRARKSHGGPDTIHESDSEVEQELLRLRAQELARAKIACVAKNGKLQNQNAAAISDEQRHSAPPEPPSPDEESSSSSDTSAGSTESDSDSGSERNVGKVQFRPEEQQQGMELRRRSSLYKREVLDPETEVDDWDIEKRGNDDGDEKEEEDESVEDAASPATSRHEARPLSPSAKIPISRPQLHRADHENIGSVDVVKDRMRDMKITYPAHDINLPEAYEPRDKAQKIKLRKLERPAETSHRSVSSSELSIKREREAERLWEAEVQPSAPPEPQEEERERLRLEREHMLEDNPSLQEERRAHLEGFFQNPRALICKKNEELIAKTFVKPRGQIATPQWGGRRTGGGASRHGAQAGSIGRKEANIRRQSMKQTAAAMLKKKRLNGPSEPLKEEEKADLLSDSSTVPHMISSSSSNSDSGTEREKKAHKAKTHPEQQQQQQDALWRRGLGDGEAEEYVSESEEGEMRSDEDDKGKGELSSDEGDRGKGEDRRNQLY
ncbi:hypothetical protein FA10DRAFT_292111 [Acaromyces ingoldii]|uniref:Uncharacterized protein n=1 Tax=Acaromyces ingoldii TaxID=215250 RepID=A0A316YP47_9BASI|nr:hypothetical protein FA10DRAFT_292111 [Acaromyces ingoldii]PWN91157.1 hypothetical protein FA10DRAFT_292111 [Acaromyces ingoldii]